MQYKPMDPFVLAKKYFVLPNRWPERSRQMPVFVMSLSSSTSLGSTRIPQLSSEYMLAIPSKLGSNSRVPLRHFHAMVSCVSIAALLSLALQPPLSGRHAATRRSVLVSTATVCLSPAVAATAFDLPPRDGVAGAVSPYTLDDREACRQYAGMPNPLHVCFACCVCVDCGVMCDVCLCVKMNVGLRKGFVRIGRRASSCEGEP